MPLLTDDIRKFLDRQKLGFVATVSPDNKPNVSPKGTIIVWNESHLAFADIRSPDTVKNLSTNNFVEINVIDPILRKGYLFRGKTKTLQNGDEYNELLKFYRAKGISSPIGVIFLVDVYSVEEVTSPLYDLGMTEEEIKSKWKKHFLDMY